MKKLIVLVTALLAFINIQAQQKKWTLQECVLHALENNISVKQSELDLQFAEIAQRDALGNFIPSVNINSNLANSSGLTINPTTNQFETTRFTSFSGNATTALTLFDGLRNVRELQRAKLSEMSSRYSLEKMKDDIALFVANSYLQVLFNKQSLKVLLAQNEVTRGQLDRTRELVDAGVLPRGDLLEIEATNADEQQRIVVAENNIQISLISLAQTLLIKDYANFDIVDDDFEVYGEEILVNTPADIISKAREERYEIRIAEENRKIAEKDVQLARGAYYPTLNAFFNYNTRYADNDPFQRNFLNQLYDNDGTSYGLQLNIPVLNGFAARNQVKRNQINVMRAQYNLEQAELDLESNVYQAYIEARGALKAYEAAQASQRAQELAFDYATQRFEVGLTNAFDFSQSKLRYENAQTEVVRTKYDYIFKLKVIELYFGIPVTDLKF